MGWTSMRLYPGETPESVLRAVLRVTPRPDFQRTVLALKNVGSTYYAAVEDLNGKPGAQTREVWAAIILTSKRWSDGSNFGYKRNNRPRVC